MRAVVPSATDLPRKRRRRTRHPQLQPAAGTDRWVLRWRLNEDSVRSGDRRAVSGRFQVSGAMHSETTLASKRPGPGHHAVKPSAGTDRWVLRWRLNEDSVRSGDRRAVNGRFQVLRAIHSEAVLAQDTMQ